MKGFVIFLLALIVIFSFSFIVISAKNINVIKNETAEKPKNLNFSTFTSAVCQHKEDFVNCKDELFVKCNGEISKAVDGTKCNGINIGIPKATGAAVFGNDWKDPRN